jgi:hypothetical protein
MQTNPAIILINYFADQTAFINGRVAINNETYSAVLKHLYLFNGKSGNGFPAIFRLIPYI